MTNRVIALVTLVFLGTALVNAFPSDSQHSDDASAIQAVIEKHYVEGMYVRRDPGLLRAGLAPTFVFHRFWKNEFENSEIADWFGRMKLDRVPSGKKVESKVTVLDVTGVAAVARLDLYVDSRHEYTDYFGLYKGEDGWKLVSKIFHYHE